MKIRRLLSLILSFAIVSSLFGALTVNAEYSEFEGVYTWDFEDISSDGNETIDYNGLQLVMDDTASVSDGAFRTTKSFVDTHYIKFTPQYGGIITMSYKYNGDNSNRYVRGYISEGEFGNNAQRGDAASGVDYVTVSREVSPGKDYYLYVNSADSNKGGFGAIINMITYETGSYTVTFRDGSKILTSETVNAAEGVQNVPEPEQHNNRRFIGWYVDGSRDTILDDPSQYSIVENTTFEAAYELDCEESEANAYLFAYFTNNNEGEKLYYGVSKDGYNFRTLNNGDSVFESSLGTKHLRDPFIFRGEDGYYYIVVTDLHGTSTPNSTIAIFKSADLISICGSILFDYKQFDNFKDTTRAWAPQIIWCPEHKNDDGTVGAYMIYLAILRTSDGSKVGTVMYHQFATDLMDETTYTEPEMMLKGQEDGQYKDGGAIDGDIIYDSVNNRYLMYFDGGAIAECDTVDGIYEEIETRSFDRSIRVEGSNMYKIYNQNKWVVMADGNAFGSGFNVAETEDFNTYRKLTKNTDYTIDFTPRHGYVIPISKEQLQILFDEYGEIELPDIFSEDPLDYVNLPYKNKDYKISGNINLPNSVEGFEGTTISWQSSNEEVISTQSKQFTDAEKAEYGENYTEYPAGRVTRQAEDTNVTLTATVTKPNEESYTKEYNVTVKAAPEKNYKQMSEDGDFKGYLYASFIEPPKNAEGQQVYFASSDDGRNWSDLNNNKPVLKSTLGTGSTRDHYIVRSPEGDRFYIIATDLNCFESGKTWDDYANRGSKSLMVWESDDLVNWSEQRMVKVADDNTGCAWAPEAIYDEITGEYIVYWSGQDINPESESYGKKVVYYSKTRDFYSFSEQHKFVYPNETDGTVSGTSDNFIDTTMIEGSDGNFYRTTKYEGVSPTQVFLDVSKYPLGTYSRVKTNLSESAFLGTEGPGWFKLNKDDAEATGKKYCLMLDGYNGPNKGVGFFPTVVDDLNNTEEINFERVKSDFKMRTGAKHGGIIPLTQDEYDRVNTAYESVKPSYTDNVPGTVYSYNFEQNSLSDISAVFNGGASIKDDTEKGSRVLYLDGTSGSYMEFDAPKDEDGNVLENYTVSFDLKNNTTGNYFNFYIGDGSSNSSGKNYLGVKAADSILISAKDSSSEIKQNYSLSGVQGNWKHFDITVSNSVVQLYVDKTLIGSMNGYMMSDINASKIRFGFSAWSKDNASNAYYDNIKVYPAALSESALNSIGTEQRPDEKVSDKLLFAMNFNNQDMTALKGTAQANGDITYDKSDDGSYAAVLNGTDAYISAAADDGSSILKGRDNVVITMRMKAEKPASNGWYVYAAPNSNAQENSKRNYIGVYYNDKQTVAERFLNNRTGAITSDSSLNGWKEITYVIGKDKSELYINGVYSGGNSYNYTLSQIMGTGNNQIMNFGKANWGSGEYAKGLIDDIAVFDFAPIIEVEGLSNVKSDLVLPSASEDKDGYSISWTSSDESVITSSGKVTRPQSGRKKVTLTAAVKFGNHVIRKDFEAVVKGINDYDFNLSIENKKSTDIQDNMFGLFFEDINYAADGGLYAEMIENRSFEEIMHNNNDANSTQTYNEPGYAWSAVDGTMSYKEDTPLNENNTHYLEFSGKAFKNKAYEGMYIEEGKKYKISFYAKSNSYSGGVNVSAEKDGITAMSGEITNVVTPQWAKYEKELTAEQTVRYSDFIVSLAAAGTVDFDMISVMPSDAVCGVFRKDLAEKLKALNPGFLRFPGGCVIEGWDIDNRYQWKNSVGPVEQRVQNWNRWATSKRPDFLSYNQTLGLGFYEYFELCEYLNCDAVPVMNVGMSCEYQGKETVPVFESDGKTYTKEFYSYIQDALDLIEFANGDENTEWGKVRADMGHKEPFNLTMLGIGNEQWKISGNQWYERYEAFEKEIHKVYPEMKLIGTSGPSASGSSFDDAWSWIRDNQSRNSSFTYAVDEHYYMSPSWFLANDTRYDNYDRDTKVFAGEYAAHTTLTSEESKKNNLESAISEAAFMTGLERNADVVYMASYAPLFARINYTQWAPDMIWFNDVSSYATPNYYVQKLYMNNTGAYTLNSAVTDNDDKVYTTTSFDTESGDIIIKVVNPYDYEQKMKIYLDSAFELTGKADIQTLTGNAYTDVNSMDNPENVAPVSSTSDVSNNMIYTAPAMSFVVMRIHTSRGLVSVSDSEISGNKLTYKLAVNGDVSAYDIYTSVYDEDNRLVGTMKNSSRGEFEVNPDKAYKIKVMLWNKDTEEPAAAAQIYDVENSTPYRVLSYTTDGSEYKIGTVPVIGNSLHLAVSENSGASYDTLNAGVGVLFAEADYTDESNPNNLVNGVSKMLKNPYIFRLGSGGFGVITARGDGNSDTDSTDGKAMIYTSDDLTSFDFKGYIELDNSAVSKLKCEYIDGAYRIYWTNAAGERKEGKTSDFKNISEVKSSDYVSVSPKSNISGANSVNSLEISKKEYEELKTNLNPPEHIGFKEIADIEAENGNVDLPEFVTAMYNDGSEADYPVEWDTDGIDFSKAGTYKINGKVKTKEYASNMIANRADPCMLNLNGKYYFVATRDSGGQTVINIRTADSIEEIANSEEHEIYSVSSGLVWAPEIHNVNGKLMIFFATGKAWNYVQSHVMVLNGDDPLSREAWSSPVRIKQMNGEYLIDKGITLDMTCFNYDSKWYYAWAQRVVGDETYGTGSSDIYIAEINPENPEILASEAVVISKPVYGWERNETTVDEGPFTIQHNGRLFMTIATNGCSPSYAIKLLSLKEGGNPLNAEDWKAKGYPILATAWNTSEPGPGHSSFTTDENGNDILIYHWGKSGKGRTTSGKRVHWSKKGEPVLNILRGEELTNDAVTATVIVK